MLEPEPLINIADYARAARGRLSKEVCDYFEGGALDEIALRENTAGWERLKLYYRVLAGVGDRDMTTMVLGQPISMPIVVAPTAFHKLACEARRDRDSESSEGGRNFVHPEFAFEYGDGSGLRRRRRVRAGFSSTSTKTARSRSSW